jgi:AmmeMemoRadiSam system protein A
MSSTESGPRAYSDALRARLMQVARRSVAYGLEHGQALPVAVGEFPEELRAPRASFVTLHLHGQLRGCIGSLEAFRPLVEDVAQNAYAAAFRDPRFPPVGPQEVADLAYHLAVLSPPEALPLRSEAELLQVLRPGVDGLILQEGWRRGTFLPAVWESLPRPEDFVTHLKLKAGLPPDHWSDTIKVYRYTTEAFS